MNAHRETIAEALAFGPEPAPAFLTDAPLLDVYRARDLATLHGRFSRAASLADELERRCELCHQALAYGDAHASRR